MDSQEGAGEEPYFSIAVKNSSGKELPLQVEPYGTIYTVPAGIKAELKIYPDSDEQPLIEVHPNRIAVWAGWIEASANGEPLDIS